MNVEPWLSGQRRGLLPWTLRLVLQLAAFPYEAVMRLRNRRYDQRKSPIHNAAVPVISIGNITTGGTGKTPLVSFLAKHLSERGLRVVIVSRGYGATDGKPNDEAMELASELPTVPHVQSPDRVAAARIAVEKHRAEVILLDDGFQHRRLHRDLNIVVIDATNPFGFDHLLPRGLLREPLSSLRRADAIVLSRVDRVSPDQQDSMHRKIAIHASQAVCSTARHQPSHYLHWPDRTCPLDAMRGKSVAVVCAIGNPKAFEATLRQCGLQIVAAKLLPDHDAYSQNTKESLIAWAETLEPEIEIICTRKDLVKLRTARLGNHELSALVVQLQFLSGQHELLHLVDNTVTG